MRAPSVKPHPNPEVARALPNAAPVRAEFDSAPSANAQSAERIASTPPKHTGLNTPNAASSTASNRTELHKEAPIATSVSASSGSSPVDSLAPDFKIGGGNSGSSDLVALAEQWQSIVNQLGLKAYARQLPYQSELIEWNATSLVLRCEKASLATDDNALKVLRQNLDEYFSARQQPTPTLRVHIAESGQVRFSPQKLALQAREAHLAQARAAISQHPTIQQIVHEFDGMILPNSIMPE